MLRDVREGPFSIQNFFQTKLQRRSSVAVTNPKGLRSVELLRCFFRYVFQRIQLRIDGILSLLQSEIICFFHMRRCAILGSFLRSRGAWRLPNCSVLVKGMAIEVFLGFCSLD